MGRMQAQEMAEMLPMRVALEWHLQGNHYPPLPVVLVDTCVKAIELGNAGQWDDFVGFPQGYGFKAGATVGQIVEAFHLDSWINEGPEDRCDMEREIARAEYLEDR